MEKVTERECSVSPCPVALQTMIYLALHVVSQAGGGVDGSIMFARFV